VTLGYLAIVAGVFGWVAFGSSHVDDDVMCVLCVDVMREISLYRDYQTSMRCG
jgi:hypothetical protein